MRYGGVDMGKIRIALAPYYQAFNEEEYRPYCLNYTNSGGELSATRLTYNAKGLNDMGFYQNITGGRSSRNFHAFDGNGRLVRKDREYNDGETSTELFTYGAKGRLIEETFENSKGARGRATYVYDEAGHAVAMQCEGYKGWLTGKLEFEPDSQGRRIAGRLLKDGQAAGTIEFEYDRGGNLIREHWAIGDWSQTFQHVYEDLR